MPSDPFEVYEFKNISAHLSELSITASDDFNLTCALIIATSETLKSLDVGYVPTNEGKVVMDIIQPILPQLTAFSISDGAITHLLHTWPQLLFLESAIKDLKHVEYLSIGTNGYDPSTLFRLLAALPTLRHFVLEKTGYSNLSLLRPLSVEAITSFLQNAPPAHRTVSFPSTSWLENWWERRDEIIAVGVECQIAIDRVG